MTPAKRPPLVTVEDHPWWEPVPTDAAYFARLRSDYPENAHMSDDELRDHYEVHEKYVVTWDHVGDAYAEYEPLADAYLSREADRLAVVALAAAAERERLCAHFAAGLSNQYCQWCGHQAFVGENHNCVERYEDKLRYLDRDLPPLDPAALLARLTEGA